MNLELKFLPDNLKNAIGTLKKAKVQYEKRKELYRKENIEKPIEEIMSIILSHESSKSRLDELFKQKRFLLYDSTELFDLAFDEDNSEYLEKLNSAEKMLDEKTFKFYYESYKDALKDSCYDDACIRRFAKEAADIIMKCDQQNTFYDSKAEKAWNRFWPDGQGYAAPGFVLHHKNPNLKFENKTRYNQRVPSDLVMISHKTHSKLHCRIKQLNRMFDRYLESMADSGMLKQLKSIDSEKDAIAFIEDANDLINC